VSTRVDRKTLKDGTSGERENRAAFERPRDPAFLNTLPVRNPKSEIRNPKSSLRVICGFSGPRSLPFTAAADMLAAR
jgi:hypothetical protein